MRISKCFLVVCAAAYGIAALPVHAADSDTDAKLREAMRQKMAELEAQSTVPSATTNPSPATAKPKHKSQSSVAQSTSAQPPVNQESITKARETLHQQMKELESQPPAATPAANPAPKVAGSQPGQKSPEAKSSETAGKSDTQPKPDKAIKKPAKGTAFPPIPVPPPAISADKDARLAELLRKYKADEITPEEYHQQRAKILSEP